MTPPIAAFDAVRLVAAEARSALPNAPVLPEEAPSGAVRGIDKSRAGLGAVLRRLADWVEPAYRVGAAPTSRASAGN